MKKFLKLLSIIVIFSIVLTSINVVNADETKQDSANNQDSYGDELYKHDGVIRHIDEDGNIYEATDLDESGIVESSEIQLYSVQAQRGIVNFRTKNFDQITQYTEDVTGRGGYTHGHSASDAAYIEHSADQTRVKFMQSGVVGWVPAAEVQVLDYNDANVKSVSHYDISNGRIIHRVTTNLTGTTYASNLDIGPASAAPYLRQNTKYYSYDGHYFYENYSTMLSDYRNNRRTNSVNPNEPYYNYFQFLSHRSASNYSSIAFNNDLNSRVQATSKMRNTGHEFVHNQNTYGINALLMIGVAANESGWGMSNISQRTNNLFGHGAFDSNTGAAIVYPSVDASIANHAHGFLSRGYLNPGDWRYAGAHLGDKASGVNVQYASDPYWGAKAAAIAWRIDRDNGNQDAFKYTIGIKDTINTSHTLSTVRNEASTTATALYTTAPSSPATRLPISNYPFIVMDNVVMAQNNFYKIQSDPVLNANRTGLNVSSTYSWTRDYAYIPNTNTRIVSLGKNATLGSTDKPVISNIQVTNITSEGYTISATVTGNVNITRVMFPTWTSSGQEDIIWHEGTITGNTASVNIKSKDYNNTLGPYFTHIYVYNAANNYAMATQNGIMLPASSIGVEYETHVRNIDWQAPVTNGNTAGTIGRALSIEAMKIRLINNEYDGGISYQSHVEDIGWQNAVSDGATSGTVGQVKKVEAIRVQLTGEVANHYDVYYRAHVPDSGWLGWAKNGASAGTTGFSSQVEAIEIVLVEKNGNPPGGTANPFRQRFIRYEAHSEDLGWQGYRFDGATAGTVGRVKQLEAVKIDLLDPQFNGSIEYSAHVENIGWQNPVTNGAIAGTEGRNLQMEAIRINLTGDMAKHYDIYYRAHVENFDWLGWATNGSPAGSEGYWHQMEALEVVIVPKGAAAPGTTANSFRQK